jgi:hypothetical protein
VRKTILLAALLAGLGRPAFAQSHVILVPNSPTNAPTAVTMTNTDAAVVASAVWGFVEVENQSTTATVYCNWGSAATASATAGQYTIPPLGGYIWGATNPPPLSQALHCISSTSSSPATVRAW